MLRRFPPALCKMLWVPRKALYKCKKCLCEYEWDLALFEYIHILNVWIYTVFIILHVWIYSWIRIHFGICEMGIVIQRMYTLREKICMVIKMDSKLLYLNKEVLLRIFSERETLCWFYIEPVKLNLKNPWCYIEHLGKIRKVYLCNYLCKILLINWSKIYSCTLN